MPNSTVLEGLNQAQHAAVIHQGGPLLVVAGAGSGKTRVITHRIAYLISEGMSPFEILAITFTNKAAEEMKARVGALVGPVAERMWVSTFHSACVRILHRDAERLGFSSRFSIYDQADSRRLTSYVIRDLNLDPQRFPPRSVRAAISAAKNENIGPEHFADQAYGLQRKVADVYFEYQRRLLAAGAMDFDDLLMRTSELFRAHRDVLAYWRGRFGHVLVDEYQDTNLVQNELVVMLSKEHRQIAAVGDSDQSIYSFRGADVRNILEFERAFPDVTVIVLDRNYRSTQPILSAANAVVSQNQERQPKDLWTDVLPEEDEKKIVHYHAVDADDEARWVADELSRLHKHHDLAWGDMAVFYRVHSQSRVIEEFLLRVGIPYRVVAGTRFFDRREVKDAVSYVRAVINPTDEVSVKRVLNTPKRGIGQVTVARLDAWAAANNVGFDQALLHYLEAGVKGSARDGIRNFLDLTEQIRETANNPASVLTAVLQGSGYLDELQEDDSIEAETRMENLLELIGMAHEFETIDEFLEKVALVNETDALEDDFDDPQRRGSGVALMTVHAAKGLEYPVVFLIGMEEGVFPHMRTMGDPTGLEEERRLAYVGITRAMKRLHLTCAWSRMMHGITQYNPPSRFIDEIPAELVDRIGDPVGRRRQGSYTSRIRSSRDHMVTEAINAASTHTRSTHDRLDFAIGDDVRHFKFGDGVVLGITGVGDKAEVFVNFSDFGEKHLLLALARLEKISIP